MTLSSIRGRAVWLLMILPLLTAAGPDLSAQAPDSNTHTMVDFKLFKADDPVKIGDLSVTLKKADKDSQKFSVDIFVGTRRIEKRDHYAGEPIVLYLGNDLHPHELLVRFVFADRVEGRLAQPKVPATTPGP